MPVPASQANHSPIIAAVLTCHNRREKTLECLRHLMAQELPGQERITITLMDDGSIDGTADAVKAAYPSATVLHGDGSLFWCGGMRAAWGEAATSDPDYYFLLNDDTMLNSLALASLLEITSAPEARRIAVAAIRDPDSGQRSYGGYLGDGTPVEVTGKPEPCEIFNANAALVTRAVYRELGIFHDAYTHAMGDVDYGYQATRRGIAVIQSPTILGTCPRNPLSGTWKNRELSRRERFRRLQSTKGLPWREWVVYNRRNRGWLWPWRSITPWLRIMLGR